MTYWTQHKEIGRKNSFILFNGTFLWLDKVSSMLPDGIITKSWSRAVKLFSFTFDDPEMTV